MSSIPILCVGNLNFGYWCLFGTWCLKFGISHHLFISPSLSFREIHLRIDLAIG
jgi:hypothetical protein